MRWMPVPNAKQSIKAEVARRDRRGLEGEGVEAYRDDVPLGPAKAVLTLIGESA